MRKDGWLFCQKRKEKVDVYIAVNVYAYKNVSMIYSLLEKDLEMAHINMLLAFGGSKKSLAFVHLFKKLKRSF